MEFTFEMSIFFVLFGVMEYFYFSYLNFLIFLVFYKEFLSFVNFALFFFIGNHSRIIKTFIFDLIEIFIFYLIDFFQDLIAINQTVFIRMISFISFLYYKI